MNTVGASGTKVGTTHTRRQAVSSSLNPATGTMGSDISLCRVR